MLPSTLSLIGSPPPVWGMARPLVEALSARGLVCVVGAGGKKSTIYRLAGMIPRAVVTATVRIPHFDDQVAAVHVTDDPVAVVSRTAEWPIGVVANREATRYMGYDPAVVASLARDTTADAVLVKADGARTRWLKAPNDAEPRIPETATTVIPIVSAKIVGKPLTEEHVHRPDRVAAITGLERGDPIDVGDVATVITHDAGGLKRIPPAARTVPLINMVDHAAAEEIAHEIAASVAGHPRVSHVVLSSMTAADPVVAVVGRE